MTCDVNLARDIPNHLIHNYLIHQHGGREKVIFYYYNLSSSLSLFFLRTQIIGVVGDVRRDMEGHHYAEKCSVFGINATELAALQR